MLEYRMYGLVPYNISPIQQGIQFGHAVVEYGLKYGNTEIYQEWANNHKTFIILNGGTTNNKTNKNGYIGTLNKHKSFLTDLGYRYGYFHEPDLGDQLTAIVFIIDERVFDLVKYPDFSPTLDFEDYQLWKSQFNDVDNEIDKIIKLRQFIKQFKLA